MVIQSSAIGIVCCSDSALSSYYILFSFSFVDEYDPTIGMYPFRRKDVAMVGPSILY